MSDTVMVVKFCGVCEQQTTVEVDATKFRRWQAGALIQTVWPDMTVEDRELLISGTHPECWVALFADQDEEQGYDY